jgi:hypothetical protein
MSRILAATFGLAAQSCGVWSSPSTCSERATCPETQEGTPDSVGPDAWSDPDRNPGSDPPDGSVGLEGQTPMQDAATGDVLNGDAGIRDGRSADVVSEPSAGPDASIDGVDDRVGNADAMQDVVASDSPSGGCVSQGAEDCTNGVDDDCNGKVDCADPACGAFTCIAPVPSGWLGPVALWQGPSGSAHPSCPTPFGNRIDANGGLNSLPAMCGCTCAASGQACLATGVFHADQACGSAPCASLTPGPSGSCTSVPANVCGSGGRSE